MKIESGEHAMSDEDRTFFADLAEVVIMEADDFIETMTTDNFDLSMVMIPSCDPVTFIFAGKLFDEFVYADDVKDISEPKTPLPAFYVQVWQDDKSVIIAKQFRDDCDINWRDEKLDISNLAKALTTLMLDAEDDDTPVIKTMCKVIAATQQVYEFHHVLDKGEEYETRPNVI